jgi:hypothetical protein
MKYLNVLLFIAAFAVVLLLGMHSDTPNSNQPADPNPMKVNQEQFARIQPSFYAEGSK